MFGRRIKNSTILTRTAAACPTLFAPRMTLSRSMVGTPNRMGASHCNDHALVWPSFITLFYLQPSLAISKNRYEPLVHQSSQCPDINPLVAGSRTLNVLRTIINHRFHHHQVYNQPSKSINYWLGQFIYFLMVDYHGLTQLTQYITMVKGESMIYHQFNHQQS